METELCAMAPEDWSVRAIEDVCARVTSGGTPSRRDASYYVNGTWPWVKTQELQDNWIDRTEESITERAIAESSAKVLPANTVLVAMYGATVGQLGLLRRPMTCNQACCALIVDEEAADYRFVFYQLRHARSQLKSLATGAAQQNLSGQLIRSLRFPYPSVLEQRAITRFLGTLDDKIELNRRTSETLEAMARTLFKSWFVDFEPVHAKSEGRNPDLPKSLADLFPSSFEESELGEVPKGWEVGPLGQFFEIGLGGAWGEEEQSPRATVPVRCLRGIDCHNLAEGRVPDVPVRWLSAKQVEDRKLPEGAILIEGSGSFCGRSLIWRRSYEDLIGRPASYSNFCKRLDPRCSAAKALVCWMQMRQAYRAGLLQSFRIGTAFPNFDIHSALSNLIVVVPPEPLADAFAKMLVLSQRLDLMAQSRTLATLRDTLLPKLISGELRVPSAEGIAGTL